MAFNSLNFLFIFLPAFFLSYFLVNDNFKNIVILIYSIMFYIFGNINHVEYIVILFALTFTNYLFIYIAIRKSLKRMLIVSITINIIVLIIFKLEILSNVMPVGLSFYVFHYVSILIDVYNDKIIKKNISFHSFISYILFFPKLLSGPITRYNTFLDSHNKKNISEDNFILGIYIFSVGLGLKCLLSDNITYIINQINTYGFDSISIVTSWIGMYSYTAKLYFDFAGYSMMAIGIAKAIGMTLPDNFNLPFSSKSVSEFWRRWHITLGHFFRDYVYIPLGGNCKNKNLTRQIFNLFIVWVLTGLWHGFKINYVLWAIGVLILIILEKVVLNKIYNKVFLIGHIVVILFIPFTFLLFSIENVNDLGIYISRLFCFESLKNARDFETIIGLYWKTIILSIIFMTNYPKKVFNYLKKYKLAMIIMSIILIALSCYMINIGQNDTFKYFTF